MTSVELQGGRGRRAALRRSRQLNRLTIVWNVAGGTIAIVAGVVRDRRADRRAGRTVRYAFAGAHVRLLLDLSREHVVHPRRGAG